MNRQRKYPLRKRDDIEGFFVACASAKETGLPFDILIASFGSDERRSGCPRIGVVIGDDVVPVSIAVEPSVLSDTCFDGEEVIKAWVLKHRSELLEHWNNELSDRKLLEILCH